MSAALALALAPITASAGEPPADAPVAEPPSDIFPPIDIPAPEPPPAPEPQPEPLPPEPEPQPVPEADAAPVEGPTEPQGLTHEQRAKLHTQRHAGIGVMAGGGVLVSAGLGMTLAFTILGDAAQRVQEPMTEDIERNDSLARVGGILIASGVAVAAIGGIIFVKAERKAKEGSVAQVRVVPALGGLVLSGRF